MNIPPIQDEHIEGNPTHVHNRGVKFIISSFKNNDIISHSCNIKLVKVADSDYDVKKINQ